MLLQKIALFISRKIFRAEVRGLDRFPDGPCLIVGNHNGIGVVNPEIWIFGSAYLNEKNLRPMKVLGHDLALKLPLVRSFARETLGYVPNSISTAVENLKAGHNVLVYPGGSWESCRPTSERDKIDFKSRTGFMKIAQEAGVPIVAVVAAGAHDGVYIWKRGHRIAKFLGLQKFLRIDSFPIGLSFPFVFHTGLLPFLPIPRKVIIEILPPIPPEEASSVTALMQAKLDTLVRELPRSK